MPLILSIHHWLDFLYEGTHRPARESSMICDEIGGRIKREELWKDRRQALKLPILKERRLHG